MGKFNVKSARPAQMKAVGLNWVNVRDVADHCIALLDENGKDVLDLVKSFMLMINLVSERNMTGILDELQKDKVNVTNLIAAIKKEFGITD